MSSHYARLRAGVSTFYRKGWTSPQLDPHLVEQAAAQALSSAVVVIDGPTDTAEDLLTVPVVMCVWNRLGRTKKVLRAIAQSRGISAEVYLWNNRADAIDEIVDDLRSCPDPPPRTILATSDPNIGGFGRFYWARELASACPFVVFVDDDQVLDHFALRDLVSEWKPATIRSIWAYEFKNRFQYWHRQEVDKGAPATYVGTGGMVVDTAIFTDQALFECPVRYWFMEDIWLSYYAQTARGWGLYRSTAEIGTVEDGLGQYRALKAGKHEFYRELNKDGRWANINVRRSEPETTSNSR